MNPLVSPATQANQTVAPLDVASPVTRHSSPLLGPGFQALFYKECLRFWKVAAQTVVAPVVTTLLYLLIFSHVLQGTAK